MKKLLVAILLILSSSVWGQNPQDIQPDEILKYKQSPEGELSLHVFYPNSQKKGKNRTVVVHFFGGAWVQGNPTYFYQQCDYYAKNDIVAISAEYRIFNLHKTTPFESVIDAKSAIRWVRQHAKQLGINPKKIVASGGSAGGHIAACTATIEGYEDEDENLKVSSKPNALVLYCPVIDTSPTGYGDKKHFQGKGEPISPTHHVKKGIVPTLVMHGTADKSVPYAHAEAFYDKMIQAGNTCELIPFEGEGHGFFNGSYRRKTKSDDNFNKSVESALSFIKKNVK